MEQLFESILEQDKENKDVYMVALRDDTGALICYYEKHEYRNIEKRLYTIYKKLKERRKYAKKVIR